MDPARNLRRAIEASGGVLAPGAHNALAAKLVERQGFDGVYVTGFGTEGSLLARPDLGYLSRDEMLTQARHVADAVDVPVICDMEDGYGDAHEVERNIRLFEQTGVSAVHLDDERRPMKCPFIPGLPPSELIEEERMVNKIEAAVDGRDDPDFLVIARCDMRSASRTDATGAIPPERSEEHIDRLNRYAAAGADVLFGSSSSIERCEQLAASVDVPVLGIVNPWIDLRVDDLFDAGYDVVISSMPTMFAAIEGMQAHLERFAATGHLQEPSVAETMVSPDAYWDLIDLDRHAERYERDFVQSVRD